MFSFVTHWKLKINKGPLKKSFSAQNTIFKINSTLNQKNKIVFQPMKINQINTSSWATFMEADLIRSMVTYIDRVNTALDRSANILFCLSQSTSIIIMKKKKKPDAPNCLLYSVELIVQCSTIILNQIDVGGYWCTTEQPMSLPFLPVELLVLIYERAYPGSCPVRFFWPKKVFWCLDFWVDETCKLSSWIINTFCGFALSTW